MIEIDMLRGIPCIITVLNRKEMACMKISYGNASKRDV